MQRIVVSFLFIITLSVVFVAAQDKTVADKIWREVDDTTLTQKQLQRPIIPNFYRTFEVNKTALRSSLQQAPLEFTEAARNKSAELTLPMPDGTVARFAIEESPIIEPALAAKFPSIKTYRGKGIDDPAATARFDWLPNGFHAIILSGAGTILVDPYAVGDTDNYIAYFKSDADKTGTFSCDVKGGEVGQFTTLRDFLPDAPNVVSGTNLRTYRLALAATAEYTNVFRQSGDTDAQARTRALAEMVAIMNRVNGVYEREVAIRLVLIGGEDSIIYTDSATDPYTNENGPAMLSQNQANLDTIIGAANYDIGHVFSTGGGGVAGLGVPCRTNLKARGVTGLPNPVGDPFAIDYVAHEMGHQFGGEHTFNVGSGSCGPQRSSNASYEPGSGVTIMAYAGICSGQNLAGSSIDTFHVKSIEQIVAYSIGTGNVCAVTTATGNTPPTVTVETGFTIPKQTPFSLTTTASDVNNDTLTYDWQEYDLGAPANSAAENSDTDGMPRPLFRPYLPNTNPTRTFPRLQYILNNANMPPTFTGSRLTGEILPSIERTMIFQVTVRDNRGGGGGVRSRAAIVNIDAASGPFIVTAPETDVTWTTNSAQTVTWNVADTNNATVNVQNVKISLSTDGGNNFPFVLAESTPNDGTEIINVPNTGLGSNQARIKVEAVGSIFFDISGVNFTIISFVQPNRALFDFDGDGKADVSVFRSSNSFWYLLNSQAGVSGVQFGASTDKIVPADYDGDGKTDLAVYRGGIWYLQRSQLGFTGIQFGTAEDIPVPADYSGDGKAEIAVFRPSNGAWYIYNLATNQTSGAQFGSTGDKPVAADYDGDGKADLAVFRPSSAIWYLQRSLAGFTGVQFGGANDKIVPADYDGDGKADIAVFRPSNGVWYINRSQLGLTGIAFGLGTDIPTPADYDGDGKADVAVYRGGIWYLLQSQAGFTGIAFGTSTDAAVPNAYVR
ncbi:MAG: M12 family metallo-peptidase [Pyrinomonadaceae bacterium]|nr:M12 family metallo-peptidase [Pyrinomonadaceae bacterium]